MMALRLNNLLCHSSETSWSSLMTLSISGQIKKCQQSKFDHQQSFHRCMQKIISIALGKKGRIVQTRLGYISYNEGRNRLYLESGARLQSRRLRGQRKTMPLSRKCWRQSLR
jgi:hypothetical protein